VSAAAAVKYEQLLKRSGSRTRRFPERVRVSAPGHVTSGRREQSATQDAQEFQNPQSRTAAENTLSQNHVVPKYRLFLRNARRRVKYLGETKRAVSIPNYCSNSLHRNSYPLSFSRSLYSRIFGISSISRNFPRYRIIHL